MSKEAFKLFAKNHPELAQSVISGKTNWQTLYELYDIYGDKSSVWNTYITPPAPITQPSSFRDIFSSFKNLDMESVQRGVTNIQKTINLIQDMGFSNNRQAQQTYEPRPTYRYFED